MEVNTVIGLEVHVVLLTSAKLFCGCKTAFGAKPNSQSCPACLGLPGSLPVLNSEAVTQGVRAALALGCRINETSIFARKNYFYPDLPKGYQITQHLHPLAEAGSVDIGNEKIAIARLHLEEDAGKLFHTADSTLVDFNRSGIPLAEIVTTPCLSSPGQARIFLEKLKQILEYAQVSDCKLEEGSMRCDANISLHQAGLPEPGPRTEIKNLNSFRAVERALECERQRQLVLLRQGKEIRPATLRWDEVNSLVVPMRTKEQAPAYRYFPEPDLPPLVVSGDYICRCRESLPELPLPRKKRFLREYGIGEYVAEVLTRTRAMADWFEQTVQAGADPLLAANWLTGEVSRLLNQGEQPLPPQDLARLLSLLEEGAISGTAAKQVLAEMFAGGFTPDEIVQRRGLEQVSDPLQLEIIVRKVVLENSAAVADFQAGKERAFKYLMGQGMKLSRGRANPKALERILLQELDKQ
jgi:aspartyl-tRNA(Asn)/glutamyl-tRNA(Gln) amidotransferase subunit B